MPVSITEIKNRLPKEFMENLYEMFTPGMVDNILKGIIEKRYTTLRVNTLKYNAQELMRYFKEQNIKFERVLWYPDAFVIKNANEKDIQKLEDKFKELDNVEKVDVCGKSIGKGFQGTIKRYNHHRGPMGHGSGAHRIVGSMGPIKGNMKGKKMPGHMGHDTVTLQNLTIALVDAERQLILIRGNVPGPKSGLVEIKTAVKSCK